MTSFLSGISHQVQLTPALVSRRGHKVVTYEFGSQMLNNFGLQSAQVRGAPSSKGTIYTNYIVGWILGQYPFVCSIKFNKQLSNKIFMGPVVSTF